MNCIDRIKTAGILLAVIACVVVTAGWASAQQASGLTAVGAAVYLAFYRGRAKPVTTEPIAELPKATARER